ncbi:hypothetical protein [Sporolactobacillus laevolacticus]|uniref:Uncharacterized protein n=1 Tax=Sporolactobacillus laevolacticus DSM 442 TaxID=1395513 RepID=V6J0M6_9BACL|nr:hypothetical protein [Sporolactobacillus laevolacticus]EST10314.1 hypothetical protein P343_17760 [Sporolactobacillus laevolacticus DSM 442]
MFIENVRSAIDKLNIQQKSDLAVKTHDIMIEKHLKDTVGKPSEIIGYIDNFVNAKDTSTRYLEGYLFALNEMCSDGEMNALISGETKGKSWKNVLTKITDDISSPQLNDYIEDEEFLVQLKNLFITIVNHCVVGDKKESLEKIEAGITFIKIFKSQKS